jgi:hypothetical protein
VRSSLGANARDRELGSVLLCKSPRRRGHAFEVQADKPFKRTPFANPFRCGEVLAAIMVRERSLRPCIRGQTEDASPEQSLVQLFAGSSAEVCRAKTHLSEKHSRFHIVAYLEDSCARLPISGRDPVDRCLPPSRQAAPESLGVSFQRPMQLCRCTFQLAKPLQLFGHAARNSHDTIQLPGRIVAKELEPEHGATT